MSDVQGRTISEYQPFFLSLDAAVECGVIKGEVIDTSTKGQEEDGVKRFAGTITGGLGVFVPREEE